MGTLERGNQAEAHVLAALVDRGIPVLIPFGEGNPYDLMLDIDRHYVRVQCKCSRLYAGRVLFNSCTTDHGSGRRDYHGLADVFGVYFPPTGDVFMVPVSDAATRVTVLRLDQTRNNQRTGIRMAADYSIGRWSPERLAALANHAPRSGTSSPPATVSRP